VAPPPPDKSGSEFDFADLFNEEPAPASGAKPAAGANVLEVPDLIVPAPRKSVSNQQAVAPAPALEAPQAPQLAQPPPQVPALAPPAAAAKAPPPKRDLEGDGQSTMGRVIDDDSFGGGPSMDLELDVAPTSRPSLSSAAAGRPSNPGVSGAPPSHPSNPAMAARNSHPSMPGMPADGGSEPQMQAAPAPPPKPKRPSRFELSPEQRAAVDLAEYGDPPEQVWKAPLYAYRVLTRKYELKKEMDELRSTRPEQIPLYERALAADDGPTTKKGVIIAAAAIALFLFLFCLPVIIRFAKLAMDG
jgi:hypothetical protein